MNPRKLKRHPNSGARQPSPDLELLYGLHTVSAALANPSRKLKRLLASQNAASRLLASYTASGQKLPIEPEIVHPSQLDRITGTGAVHQGVLLQASPLDQPHIEDIAANGLIVILDQLSDPHNFGAILRSCAAFGVTAALTTSRHSPVGSAVLAKAASGAIEHVPIVQVPNLARAMEQLGRKGYQLIGLDSEAGQSIEQLSSPCPAAIILGAEGKGLRKLTRENCDHLVRLDLPGQIKSLNVSNAAALALYVLTRAGP